MKIHDLQTLRFYYWYNSIDQERQKWLLLATHCLIIVCDQVLLVTMLNFPHVIASSWSAIKSP
jgi:hypothetical protein